MSKEINKPTDGEMEILQILWKEGPSSVKKVNEIISSKKDVGYTTTLKLMQIMTEKGLCTRTIDGKSHIYHPVLKENQVKTNFIKNMIDQVFEGSTMDLVLQTLGNYKASPQEMAELKSLIAEIEKKQING